MSNNSFNIYEFLKLAIESLYYTVIVDENGIIRYLSDNYAEILDINSNEAIGIPVEKIIPNTRLNIVAKSGIPEIGKVFRMKNGQIVICNRIPLKDKNGKIKGVISTASFENLDKIAYLNQEIEELKKKISYISNKLII